MPVDDLPRAFSPGKILMLTMMKMDDGKQNKQDGQADMLVNESDSAGLTYPEHFLLERSCVLLY